MVVVMSDRIHPLKTWPEPFGHIWAGSKKAEFRKNDRDFRVGDVLILLEWYPDKKQYSSREIHADVTHIMSTFGVPEGYVVMSIEVVEKKRGM